MDLERDYRAACQKMLVSLDQRTALNRMSEDISRLHRSLTEEGSQILAGPADDQAIQRYRGMVEKIVSKLDERDQLRQRDAFKEALRDLLQLGEQLGYARRAEPASRAEQRVEAARPVAVAAKHVPVEQPAGFSAVEQELAELQQQLVHLQQGS